MSIKYHKLGLKQDLLFNDWINSFFFIRAQIEASNFEISVADSAINPVSTYE